MKKKPSRERVCELIAYDPLTGAFCWKVDRSNGNVIRKRAGDAAGWKGKNGYVYIGIDGNQILAHRLAWFIEYGSWPDGQLDHANRDRADNRLENLRLATQSQQNANREYVSKSGVRGVRQHKKRWVVEFKGEYIGIYKTKDEAIEVFQMLSRNEFGQFSL